MNFRHSIICYFGRNVWRKSAQCSLLDSYARGDWEHVANLTFRCYPLHYQWKEWYTVYQVRENLTQVSRGCCYRAFRPSAVCQKKYSRSQVRLWFKSHRITGHPFSSVITCHQSRVVSLCTELSKQASSINNQHLIIFFFAPAGFWPRGQRPKPRGQNPTRHPSSPRVYTYKDKEYLLKK